jgi:hypothetical protein
VPPNRQFDGDGVAKHVDSLQLTMDIGEWLAVAEQELAKLLAPIALLPGCATFLAGVPQVDHAVVGEQIGESLHVHDVAPSRVVRAAHYRLCVGCRGIYLASRARPLAAVRTFDPTVQVNILVPR